jgi:hypothetical protein
MLVRAMLADGLVDELHLCGAEAAKLSRAASESCDSGVVYLAYRPQGG